ncbi:membrane bound O-acyl transferase family-domain-containing protein [Daldinia caldariorum]|uniref:membrane bound O-acyl transferase family-domain-containing protein n=1 Tax=Daldinia caldariorum TaxID=326644 RepID=UPI002008A818|nr:membrane bound O-acyl transferase family-domain-containing protein [Daldinia caldariorum]KAI1466721.1 membrane bound O-acyl transferase family-domain-containing protein [Daldinia caldariorum]
MAQQDTDLDIASAYREIYRAKFQDDVRTGVKKPFLVPLYLLSYWVIPVVYLAIPHKNRPRLYQARWLFLALTVTLNVYTILNVSSHNFASAYGAGLIGSWGIVWNFTLLVWTKPQWEAKRVDIRRKEKPQDAERTRDDESGVSAPFPPENGHTAHSASATGLELNGNGSAHNRKEGKAHAVSPKPASEQTELSDELRKILLDAVPSLRKCESDDEILVELKKLAAEQEFEYYWQEYPADASLWTRLDWAFDIANAFRMTGWNWAIPCLPPYHLPPTIHGYQLPLSATGPHHSKQGYTRQVSLRSFFLTRLFRDIVPAYLVVDFCAVHMTADPYFVLGPEHADLAPLPPHLSSLSPLTLSAYRTALSFLGTLSALQLVFSFGALALAFLPPLPRILRLRAHPWHLPSAVGSFAQVLDRGLPGFWGSWWHQTFRFGFAAPSRWLARRRRLRPGSPAHRLLAFALAFVQSGFLHASGSYSTVPPRSRWWLPPLFFALAAVGSALQTWLARRVLAPPIRRMPRWIRRLGNLAFALAWMWATGWVLVDDFGRCGLWLFEPVPVSVFRWLGYGPTRDRRVWRYERDFWPKWYWGKHWWDSGLGI